MSRAKSCLPSAGSLHKARTKWAAALGVSHPPLLSLLPPPPLSSPSSSLHLPPSVAIMDHQRALENQLSGYLLRKFKNSNGWQKLWVVFTNFCLYFYKTFQDDFPLASLPLLGYSVNIPTQVLSNHFVFCCTVT